MTARNPITGDLIQTRVASKAYLDNYPFQTKKPQRGRFRADRETGKLIPLEEWLAKYEERPMGQAPMMFMSNFDPFESPVSGRVVRNKREHQYDLDASGCRVYEGRQQEEKEAAKYRQEQEKKLEASVTDTIHQTHYEIQHGYRKLQE